ncbi:WD repeat-containing protein 46-like [Haliotis rufescens]|uniref:WD repeat-containing protein 46-like n=1 Tax=Haliotis rufescens TaxID=6454 RepID=UPI00201F721E|nr:WD repeat-containing protein 46-like [Haliotis rufescens]
MDSRVTSSLPTKTNVNTKVKKHKKKKKNKENSKQNETKTFVPDLDNLTGNKNKKRFFKWKSKHKQLFTKGEGKPTQEKPGRKKTHGKHKTDKVVKSLREEEDPYPGDAPVDEEKLKKYQRSEKLTTTEARTRLDSHRLRQEERRVDFAVSQAARAELLLQEESGFLEAEEGETTVDITQQDIVDSVDILSAQKYFQLTLKDFGPYRLNYSRNGRHLLLGGAKGHMAAFDWQTKKLMCEFNVMETVNDIKWLHQETMFAVAQRQWTYIYDNQGIELHCLKAIDTALRMEFLPYHFLLATASAKGFLTYVDTSVGKKVAGVYTHSGRLDVMCQNRSNAVVHLGHPGGTVTLWTPNLKSYAAKMLCHIGGVRSLAIDNSGKYMASSGIDGKMKIWDLRMYRMLQSYKLQTGAGSLAFSQQGMIAAGTGNVVQVFKDCCQQRVTSPYMQHRIPSSIRGVQFCPYEDVLGVSHSEGFASLLVPGSGEANFDALEVNPYQTKKQRRQAEVKMLLDKIPIDMITLDTKKVGQIEAKSYDEMIKEKNKLEFLKVEKTEFTPRYKMRGGSKAGKVEHRKQEVKDTVRREVARESNKLKQEQSREQTRNEGRGKLQHGVLNRFSKKNV